MSEESHANKIIIEGITEEGKHFHPADWAERISGSLSTLRNRRVMYSPLLRPCTIDGHRCLLVDKELETLYPALYKEIMDFAQSNGLKMHCSL